MTRDEMALERAVEPEERRAELLGFYDRVRERVERYLESKGGRLGRRTAEALLLVPDALALLIRVFLDRGTPASSRALVGGALAYFLLPADLAPEIVIGPIGFLDDLMVAAVVLGHVFGPDLSGASRRYWSGSQATVEALSRFSRAASSLLGAGMSRRVEKLVERRLLNRGRSGSAGA